MEKGFYDDRDNIRYILARLEINTDSFGTVIKAYFDRHLAEGVVGQYVIRIPNEAYDASNDIKVYYQRLVKEIQADVELPESMDWELGLETEQ